MRQRSLGPATVTALGCGDVSLATAASRGRDRRDVSAALHAALGFGITLVDVDPDADSERLCGEAVRSLRLRDTVVLAVSMRLVAPLPGAPRRDVLPERLPVGYVRERIEASLRATRLDALPLAQLPIRPAWRTSRAWSDLADLCERLVREGKVLSWGAIVDELDGAEELVHDRWLASLQVTFNACTREALPMIEAVRSKLCVLARRPLAGGALAGTLGPGVALPPRDDRHAIDDATLEAIATAVATLAPLVRQEPAAARSCEPAKAALDRGRRPPDVEATTLAELALRYVLDHEVVALPRMHRSEHIPEAVVAAGAPPLSAAVRERIEQVLAAPLPADAAHRGAGRERDN